MIQFCFFIHSVEDQEMDERLKDQNFWLDFLRLEYKKFYNFITPTYINSFFPYLFLYSMAVHHV